jgi:hypothetical protein
VASPTAGGPVTESHTATFDRQGRFATASDVVEPRRPEIDGLQIKG